MQLSGRQNGRFYYWTETDLHPDCWHKVKEGLQLALDAGGSIERIPTQGEAPTVRGAHPPDTSVPEEWEVHRKKMRAWRALNHDQRVPFILDAIGAGRRTFGEISEAINAQTDFHVHEGTVRPHVMRMIEAGLVSREGEPFHGKVRYRYFLAETKTRTED
jgi:hypothetical protein